MGRPGQGGGHFPCPPCTDPVFSPRSCVTRKTPQKIQLHLAGGFPERGGWKDVSLMSWASFMSFLQSAIQCHVLWCRRHVHVSQGSLNRGCRHFIFARERQAWEGFGWHRNWPTTRGRQALRVARVPLYASRTRFRTGYLAGWCLGPGFPETYYVRRTGHQA